MQIRRIIFYSNVLGYCAESITLCGVYLCMAPGLHVIRILVFGFGILKFVEEIEFKTWLWQWLTVFKVKVS